MASKSNGFDTGDWARAPPNKGPLCVRILKAIYDPDDNTFLGRTPKRWGIVFIFYFVFYAVLALLFATCMGGLFACLEDNRPAFTLEKSLIGVNPGVAFRPRPLHGFTLRYTRKLNTTSFEPYTQQINEFLKPYSNESWFISKTECTMEDDFGFPETPCVFIKLNKIYDWMPDFHSSDLPSDMPTDLKEYINSLPDGERRQIWVSCWEEKSNTTEIEYPWGRGLPGRFYPFQKQKGYISPLVAVKIKPPRNTDVAIRCRAWAKNIEYNKSVKEPSGYTRILVHFEDTTETNGTATDM